MAVVYHPWEGRSNTARRRRFKARAATLPRSPGVYFFHGCQGRLLYIGKATCLRQRVGSYFGESRHERTPRVRRLLAEITDLNWQPCATELEAALLEQRLIAERQPLLNRHLKRFDSYAHLVLTAETFPRLQVLAGLPDRPLALPGRCFGPLTSARHAELTLLSLQQLFPLRTCAGPLRPDPRGSDCLAHGLGRCCAPCIGLTSTGDYAALCAELVQLLSGKAAPRLEEMRRQMLHLAEKWRFEEAARLKEQLEAVDGSVRRLQRIHRMRHCHRLIVQPAWRETPGDAVAVCWVRHGLAERQWVVSRPEGWKVVQKFMEEHWESHPLMDYVGRCELDEMVILDRWLKAHGGNRSLPVEDGASPAELVAAARKMARGFKKARPVNRRSRLVPHNPGPLPECAPASLGC